MMFSCWQNALVKHLISKKTDSKGWQRRLLSLMLYLLSVGCYNLLSLWAESPYVGGDCPQVAPEGFITY